MGPPRLPGLPRLEMLGVTAKNPKRPPGEPPTGKETDDEEAPKKKKPPAKAENGDNGGGAPKNDSSKGMFTATPEMLGYITADQHCGNCKYMTSGGTCSNMSDYPVSPDDGCRLGFEAKGGAETEEPETPMETANEPENEPVGAAY